MKYIKKFLILTTIFHFAGLANTQLFNALADDKGSIAGVVRLAVIAGYNGSGVIYKTDTCFGCLVIAGKYVTITGPGGMFRLTGIPVGTYSLRIDYEACTTGKHDPYDSNDLIITEASPTYRFTSPIDLFESTATVEGVARLEGHTVHSDIVVNLAGIPGYSTTTDARGNYRIPSVPIRIRTYKLTFAKPDFSTVSLPNVLVAQENAVLTLSSVKLAQY